MIVPQHISRKAFYSAQFLLVGSAAAFYYCYYVLSFLLFCLYSTTMLHWNKVMRISFIKVADIAMAFTVMMHISFVDSMHFAPGYRAIWASSVLVSSCAFIVNEIVFYYQLKHDGEKEWVYLRSTYTHMFFLHAVPPLTCWYCVHMSNAYNNICLL